MTLALISKPQKPPSTPIKRRIQKNPIPTGRLAPSQSGFGVLGVHHSTVTPTIQPKLKIGEPNDKFEQEADQIADEVMRMPEALSLESAQTAPPLIQRLCGECNEEISSAPMTIQRICTECKEELQRQPMEEEEETEETVQAKGISGHTAKLQRQPMEEAVRAKGISGRTNEVTPDVGAQIDGLRGGGQPLSESIRTFFESRFGYDFKNVRVHTNTSAASVASQINARAFTVGRDIVFGTGQYAPDRMVGKKLLAHELTHVVQQGGTVPQSMGSERPRFSTAFQRTSEPARSQVADVIQRAGDPAEIPAGMRCPPDFTPGRPAGTSVLFPVGDSTITPAHTRRLRTFLATWLASGGTNDILVHGFASTDGDQGPNWTLSCDRAEAVQAELVRLGIPAARINVVAHGESTDFGSRPSNRRAVVSMGSPGILPLLGGLLTARDNFAGRSVTRFGVGEVIDLSFFSFPARPAADFGGLEWHLVSGGGTLTGVTNVGTATYTAPATADPAVELELRVAGGATAGRVISTHMIEIVEPSGVNITVVPGTAPSFGIPVPIPVGTWGAGFQGNVFVDPKDVSFQGVVFGEGTVAGVVTPPGSFFSPNAGLVHPTNTFGPGHAGNATTGTPVSPPVDNISTGGLAPAGTVPVLGIPFCGISDFLWAIPWEFSVAGGPRTPFAGGFTANHHETSTLFCDATIEKAGAGPVCRRINGTTC